MIDQAQPESLWHWLYTNAPAAWISAFVATAALVATLNFRKRPKRVVVRELRTISFFAVGPVLRRRIAVTIDGTAITDPRLIGYEIYNEGSDPIQNVALTIALPIGAVVLGANPRPSECPAKCERGESENLVNVSVPYLNPYREHKQLVHLLVFVDGDTRPAKASGGGEGWSVRFSPLPGRKQMRKLFIIPVVVGMATGAVSLIYLRYVARILQLGPPQITGKLLLATVPLLGLFFGSLLISRYVAQSMWSRALRPQDRIDD
jgi:hypothetical protein